MMNVFVFWTSSIDVIAFPSALAILLASIIVYEKNNGIDSSHYTFLVEKLVLMKGNRVNSSN
jgi:hypothetical protein